MLAGTASRRKHRAYTIHGNALDANQILKRERAVSEQEGPGEFYHGNTFIWTSRFQGQITPEKQRRRNAPSGKQRNQILLTTATPRLTL